MFKINAKKVNNDIFNLPQLLHRSPRSQMQVSSCHLMSVFDDTEPCKFNSCFIPFVPEKSNTIVDSPEVL